MRFADFALPVSESAGKDRKLAKCKVGVGKETTVCVLVF